MMTVNQPLRPREKRSGDEPQLRLGPRLAKLVHHYCERARGSITDGAWCVPVVRPRRCGEERSWSFPFKLHGSDFGAEVGGAARGDSTHVGDGSQRPGDHG
jgi:hypothetical protein